ncbi:MAG: dihydrolipoyl dehydrogenase [Chloroflexota bacterium]
MKTYDAMVIGSGCGMLIVEEALGHGLNVALVDKGPVGGTCLNVGCIPSKMLIYPADRMVEIQTARKLGIEANVTRANFRRIMGRMRKTISEDVQKVRKGVSQLEGLDFYEAQGHFIDDYTLQVEGERLRAETVFLASGSRPLIPPIEGIDTVDYLTNESVLQLEQRPQSLVIVGGGYIGVEYGHFFAAMGTEVTILEMADRLVQVEEPEVSALLKQELGRRMEVVTGAQVQQVRKDGGGVAVAVRDTISNATMDFSAEKVLVAVGRRSNADLLHVQKTGVETDKRGFVQVNRYLETSKESIYAVGDANGLFMFTHVANREAQVAAHNALHGEKMEMDYSAIPHAVYSWPQIASVGLTEASAKAQRAVVVGRARYYDTAKGQAMAEESGFVKAVVDRENGDILGFHVIGPYAPILIQEVVNAMASGGQVEEIHAGIHIHPALPELVQVVLSNLEEV